jgi:hypothetical protein
MKRLPRREFLVGTAASGFALTASAVMPSFAGLAPADSTSLLVSEPHNSIAAELLKKETDPFRKAVLTGDLDAVKRFVARDPSLVYSRDAQGQSVYLLAAYAGQAEVITFLEAKGITLDICEAVAGDKLDRVNELLGSAEGLLNMPNVAGDTPLHVAAICNRSGVVGNTIMYGPEFSVRNPQRKNATPAHLALAEAPAFIAEDMAFAMVGNGLDPNLQPRTKTTSFTAPLVRATRVVRLLIQRVLTRSTKLRRQTAQDIAQAGGRQRRSPCCVALTPFHATTTLGATLTTRNSRP